MAESLVLRLSRTDPAAHDHQWVVVDSVGARVAEPGSGSLADAAAALAGRRLLVLVPGADVTLAAPELPTRNAAKLHRLVPFALEEHIATELDAMHFACGRQAADRTLPVAAVERTRLQAWLDALAAAGLAPAALIPDTLLIPDNPAHVVLFLEGGRLVVRHPGGLPLALEVAPLAAALEIAGLPPPAEALAAPPHVIVYAAADDWAAAQPLLETLRPRLATLNVQILVDGALPWLAAAAVNGQPLSLLQGEYTPRQGLAGQWPRWRLAASLVAVLIVTHLAALGVDWWRLHQQEVRIDRELGALAVEALPNVQNLARLPSVRLAVEARVRRSRAAVSEGLLGTLGALGAAVGAAPGTQLQSLSYRDGTSELIVDAPDVGALDRLQQATRGRGYEAQLQGATQHEQRYQGHLQLKGPGS